MKTIKLLSAFALSLCLPALVAVGAEHKAMDFLSVQAVYVTNTLAITNFSTAGAKTTNILGTAYSNLNARVVAAAETYTTNNSVIYTNVGTTTVNLLKDVPLWCLADGSPPGTEGVLSPLDDTNSTAITRRGWATLLIKGVGGSGANTAGTMVFTPLYDGVNEATAAAEEWTVGFTPTTTTAFCLATNVPLYRWPGAKSLRLRRIVAGDTDASSHVILSAVRLTGWVP